MVDVQLVVEHLSGQTRYYPASGGWRIDTMHRVITVGRGVPRTVIPLDSVAAFHVERVR